MRGTEIGRELDARLSSHHRFVKWWRNENDFLDVETVEQFRNRLNSEQEIGGFELLTIEDMEHELKRLCGQRIEILHGVEGDHIQWHHHGRSGERTDLCTCTPENLMTIYDAETRGNPIA